MTTETYGGPREAVLDGGAGDLVQNPIRVRFTIHNRGDTNSSEKVLMDGESSKPLSMMSVEN